MVKIEDLWVEIANYNGEKQVEIANYNGEKHIISVTYRHPGGDVKQFT